MFGTFLLVTLTFCLVNLSSSVGSEKESKLYSTFLNQYESNVYILPPHNITNPVRVAIEITVISIRQLDESTESLSLEAWLKMEWNDSRLEWNRYEYNGIERINLPKKAIWHPDIRLYNGVKLSDLDTQADILSSVNHKGKVLRQVPSTFHSLCNIDLKFFPFDIQKCNLTFASWVHNGFHVEVDLLHDSGKVEFIEPFNQNNQWEVLGSRAYKNINYFPCCVEPYPDVTFEIRLRRRSPYYKYTTLYPALGVVGLTLVAFWLPPDAMDKIILGGTSFVSLILLLIHLSWKIPPTGRTIPMIIAFCGNMIMIVTASTILSVISIIWGRSKYNYPPPRWMRTILNGLVGRLLCVNSPIVLADHNHAEDVNSIDMDSGGPNEPTEATKQDYFTSEWIQCLQMVDRFNFLVFVGVITSSLAGAFTLSK